MQRYLLLGLELGLYSVAEMDQVLWYLDCLLTIRCVRFSLFRFLFVRSLLVISARCVLG